MSGKNYGPLVSGYLNPQGRNWEDVIFQSGKAVLDKELNLGQDLDIGQAETVLRRDLPSGWISNGFLNNSPSHLGFFSGSAGGNVFTATEPLTPHVNGWLLSVANTNVISTNTLTFPAPPSVAGTSRMDLCILEVWRILLAPAPSTQGKSPTSLIWGNGNVKNDPSQDAVLNYPDDIKDATIGVETTKRVQIQYRLRVIGGVDLFAHPYGIDDPTVIANTVPTNAVTPDGAPSAEAFPYINQASAGDSGLWVAGDGNPANSLGTVDGYMYAIPFFGVFRRNSTAWNPVTNMNGAGQTFGGTSDRPDGLFNDAFVSNDIADLRMAVSPVGWNYQELLDKNVTYLLDNGLRSEWAMSSVGTIGHSPFYSNQIGGTAAGGGPLVAQFDNVARTFSGRPIYETIKIAVPAPGGGWTSGAVFVISPTALPIYPNGVTNWASNAPTNSQIIDILTARWIGDTTVGRTHTYDATKANRIATVTGLSTLPLTALTVTLGTIPGALSMETLYIELLVVYPAGANGLTVTPVSDEQSTQMTFLVNGTPFVLPPTLPATAPTYFDLTLFTTDPYGFVYYNPTPTLASLNWAHREARLTYTTVLLPSFTMQANSEVNNDTNFQMPERIAPGTTPVILKNGLALAGIVSISTDGRQVTFTNPLDYTSPGDTITVVSYKAIRPFPQNGEQVTAFFNYRAPQTSRDAIIGTSISVAPRLVPRTLYSMVCGVASNNEGYPFPYAYVQTGGINAPAFTGSGAGEYALNSSNNISVANFNADVGMLALPTLVPYTPDPDDVTFSRALTTFDTEGRTFFPTFTGGYLPNAFAQDLSDPQFHKNFLPFLAELTSSSPLGFPGQLVLMMLTRWSEPTLGVPDQANFVAFGSGHTTACSVFRLKNNMLNRRA